MSKLELFHDDMIYDYVKLNKSLRFLEAKYGIQRKYIKDYLISVGVEWKKHGAISAKTQSYLDDFDWMSETYSKVNSLQRMADVLLVSKPTISKSLKRHGISTNTTNYNKKSKVNVDLSNSELPVLLYESVKPSHQPRLAALRDKDIILQSYKECRNIKVMASNFGVTYPTMQNAIHYHNIPISCNNTSHGEQIIVSSIKTYYDGDILLNTKKIVESVELDIYIPEHKIAIEFNGLKWHSEKFKSKNYHYEKYLKCKEHGIQLIQIWEDDFNLNEGVILKFIKYKLGFNSGSKVFARKCRLLDVPNNVANRFHGKYHIQGGCSTTFSVGLGFDGNLVAVCSFKRTGNTLDLVRYSTAINVVGGFTKILKYVTKTVEFDEIITFADLCHSNGNLYDISGFKVDKILAPDYKYIVDGIRKHKFGYRKKAFKSNPNLLYEPDLTERELAKLNGLYRVYDAGKIRYKYT